MFDMRLAQVFQPGLSDAVGNPKEASLHVLWKSGDLSGDGLVQDFDAPRHIVLYLIFEIYGRGVGAENVVTSAAFGRSATAFGTWQD